MHESVCHKIGYFILLLFVFSRTETLYIRLAVTAFRSIESVRYGKKKTPWDKTQIFMGQRQVFFWT